MNNVGLTRVNYLYFGFLFICLMIVHGVHVMLIESVPMQAQMAFLIDVGLQCLLEVVILLLIGQFVRTYLPEWVFSAYIALTFLLLVAHIVDFFLVRVMDVSVWFGLGLLREESFANLIKILEASSVSLGAWALFGGISLMLPLLGVFLFFLSEKLGRKREISLKPPVMVVLVLLALLTFWDLCAVFPLAPSTYEGLRKALPLKASLVSPKWPSLKLPAPLVQGEHAPDAEPFKLTKLPKEKPDIFLFICESLREDFITEQVAPHLFRFKEENISFDLSLSSANATHYSWFSLFHSKFPFYWTEKNSERKKEGSLPLKILKEMGYSIHVYTSANLSFYDMEERLFGEKHYLLDSCTTFLHSAQVPTYESDAKAIEKLTEEMSKKMGPRLHIVFFDSTHFDYSWPKETTPFLPIQEEIDYFKAAYSKEEAAGIKNRYRNAIHYIDSLFARFMQKLEETGNAQKAIVVLTGDHGEEFYEENRLFHASNLNMAQTQVPIYYKFGDGSRLPSSEHCSLTSHVDIFPSIFHYLFKEEMDWSALQGESIFKSERWPYVVAARYNAGNDPTEFYIHNGKNKILMRFAETDIFRSSQLSILSLKDLDDKNVPHNFSVIRGEFGPAFDRLFAR